MGEDGGRGEWWCGPGLLSVRFETAVRRVRGEEVWWLAARVGDGGRVMAGKMRWARMEWAWGLAPRAERARVMAVVVVAVELVLELKKGLGWGLDGELGWRLDWEWVQGRRLGRRPVWLRCRRDFDDVIGPLRAEIVRAPFQLGRTTRTWSAVGLQLRDGRRRGRSRW